MIARERQFLTRAPAKFSFSQQVATYIHIYKMRGLCFRDAELCVARFVMQICSLVNKRTAIWKMSFQRAVCVRSCCYIWLALMMSIDGFFRSAPAPYISARRWIIFFVCSRVDACRQAESSRMGWRANARAEEKIAHCFLCACMHAVNEYALTWCSYFVALSKQLNAVWEIKTC